MLQILGGLIMYTFFQPIISVEQEEADIKAMIDEEYATFTEIKSFKPFIFLTT